MAVKDGVYAQIGGTVDRLFQYNGGTGAVVKVQREGSQYPDRVTVWGIEFEARQGDQVAVKGWLSWKPSTYEKRDGSTGYGVEVSLNRPVLVELEPGQPAAEATDVWAATTPGSGDGQVWH